MRRRIQSLSALLLAGLVGLLSAQASAMGIRALQVTKVDTDSLIIECSLDLELSESIREAIFNGVGVELILEVQLREKKKFWPDTVLGERDHVFEIKYHALSEQYIIKSSSPSDRAAFPDLYSALHYKKHIPALHLIFRRPQTLNNNDYLLAQVRVRTESLPVPLRMKSYFYKQWRATSGWTVWPI